MADLFYIVDKGAVIFENGLPYKRVGQVIGTPNDVDPDVANIAGYSYSVADDQAKTIYSAEEMAVVENMFYTDLTILQANVDWTTLVASAPVTGVARFGVGDYYGAAQELRINGVDIVSIPNWGNYPGTGSARWPTLAPYNILQGSLIEVKKTHTTSDMQVIFCMLPFVYPVV